MDAMKVNFPSIFDTAVESEKDFDTMFGGEEDCDLMDAVCGFKEDGTVLPDDAELHQTDDNALPKDIKDELGEGHDTDNAPKEPKEDPEVKVDPEDIDGESDKATSNFDKAYNELMKEAAEDMSDEGDPAVEDDELGSAEEGCGSKKTVDEGCGSKKTVKEEDEEDLVSDMSDDENDSEDEEENCDDPEGCDPTDEGCCAKKSVKEEEDLVSDMSDEGDPAVEDDELGSTDEGCGSKKTVKEEAELVPDADEENLIDNVEGETSEDDPTAEEIDALNTDSDEDLIDIVAGE